MTSHLAVKFTVTLMAERLFFFQKFVVPGWQMLADSGMKKERVGEKVCSVQKAIFHQGCQEGEGDLNVGGKTPSFPFAQCWPLDQEPVVSVP